jgi:hypothetical protein
MNCKCSSTQIILTGKISDVLSYLRECEKKYKYVSELIQEMKSLSLNNNRYIN